MDQINQRLSAADWPLIYNELNTRGYAIIPGLIPDDDCKDLINNYGTPERYRKTVAMERYRFGLGEYKYFSYPLPSVIQTLREDLYVKLAPVANLWMNVLNTGTRYPGTLNELHDQCRERGQSKPTPLILRYGRGGFNTLHQDLYGDLFFPIQCVLFLTGHGRDFTGGEFVLTQQTPRAQSKAIVLTPGKGDLLIFTTNFRPEKGARGYYRVNMRHGVSEVRSGERFTLGIIFHDALS